MRSLAALRRQLLTRPGFSAKPRCPACQQETAPRDFTAAGTCRACEASPAPDAAAIDAEIMEIDRRLTILWGAGRGHPGDQMIEAEVWGLENRRAELLAPPEEGPDGLPVLPERHPPMLDGATGPFLPDED